MSRAAPGRVTVASQTPHQPLMKPLQSFMKIRSTRTLIAPLPFSAGLSINTSHSPPRQLHRLQPDYPLLSDRAGGWESRSILMGTLLDSFQSYGATRSGSPVPQATVPGKRDSSSVAAVWLSYFFVSRDDRQEVVCKIRIPSTPP